MNEAGMGNIPPTKENLIRLAQQGMLSARAYERALAVAGHTPSAVKWARFLNVLLLSLGSALSVCGIYFFFAYNWADMHRYVKLGIIEALIAGLVAYTSMVSLNKLNGKIALTVAGVLIGALLAVFGQIYQTGADSYKLFLYWVLLMGGWVFISRFTPMWLAWIVLINVTLSLYVDQTWSYPERNEYTLMLILVFINALFLISWEFYSGKTDWLISRWMPRILSLPVFFLVSSGAANFVFSGFDNEFLKNPSYVALVFLFPIVIASSIYFYSKKRLDLFILTIASICLIYILDIWLGDLLNGVVGDFTGLLMGALLIGQTALAVTFLLKVSRSWEARS